MNEILKKRIEEAAGKRSFMYLSQDRIEELELGCHYEAGFIDGAEYALSHQWISVDEALPKYDETVIVAWYNGDYSFNHRSPLCASCEYKEECKDILKDNYPKIYKLRGYDDR